MSEKIMFEGATGESLAARLDSPESPDAYVLFAHCFTCNKDLNTITRISKALNEQNLALLRFDFTGLGASKGDFANTNFSSNIADLVAAANYLREHFEAPKILMGHSFGGAAVLAAAHQLPEVKAVATIGAPADTEHVIKQFDSHTDEIAQKGEAKVNLVGRSFTIKQQFIEDVKAQKMKDHIANLNRALLLFHSPVDETVSIDNARIIYDAAKHPKSFITLDTADHLLMKDPADGQYVANLLSLWAKRYI
jgi:putative redox protein